MGAVLLGLSLALVAAAGQTRPPPTPPDYVVGPRDVLTITVFGEAQLTGPYTVDADGTFVFPWVGRIEAGGFSPRHIEDELRTKLGEGYLKRPEVSVEVQQFRSQSIFIVGEVRTPGKYALTGEMSLLEALAAAGSTMPSASHEVVIIYPRTGSSTKPTLPDEDEDADVIRVSLSDLQSGRVENVDLRDGCTVYVPKAETFFVTGQVKSPGSYVLQPNMSVLQAISLAGGLTDRGSNRRLKIIRIVDGDKVELDAKLTDLVEAGDTLVVAQRFF